jgi:arylsulfatase
MSPSRTPGTRSAASVPATVRHPAAQTVAAGKPAIRFEFAHDEGGLARGGLGTVYTNDKKVAEGRIYRTQPMMFSADDTADVGEDDGTPLTENCHGGK